MIGELPTQLLSDLKTVGFRPFGIVGSQVDIDEGPSVLVGNLTTKSIDVVVVAFY